MEINKAKLYALYMEKVDEICEELDWKTFFGAKEIVHLISKIIEDHPELIKNEKT